MDFEDLVTALKRPPNHVGKAMDGHEHHLYEGAVMVAYAMHLLRAEGARDVRIHPDGEHGKQFDFLGWLARRGFTKASSLGTTAYGGVYRNSQGQTVTVQPKSGLGDVVAQIGELVVSAECKGGIINTCHPGQVSRLYKGLCETVGMLMATPSLGRQVAVMPLTDGTRRLAERLAPRCALAGIEIALVGSRGEVLDQSRGRPRAGCRKGRLMRRLLTVGVTYTGSAIDGVEIDNLGLCRPEVERGRAAFPLYEYDTIIINPESYTHFLFGQGGEFSNELYELGKLKRQNESFDLDSAFDAEDRQKELEAAIADGATVVWCLSEPKRVNFFGYRETHLGFAAPKVASFVKRSDLLVKKGRRMGPVDPDSPFARYFDVVSQTGGWTLCLSDPGEGYASIAATPEGYSLGGQVTLGTTTGWLLTPPTSQEAQNQLVRDSLALEKTDPAHEKYHGIFLSHTGVDKPFVRQLRKDLLAHGVPRVWLDEAEIEIGDSLIAKIDEGMKLSRYIAVVLSKKSIDAPWVKKELDVAMSREISTGEVVVLPLLYEQCELPGFLQGKLYADFSKPEDYETVLGKLLRRLRIG